MPVQQASKLRIRRPGVGESGIPTASDDKPSTSLDANQKGMNRLFYSSWCWLMVLTLSFSAVFVLRGTSRITKAVAEANAGCEKALLEPLMEETGLDRNATLHRLYQDVLQRSKGHQVTWANVIECGSRATKKDVSLATHGTVAKMDRLLTQASWWGGPVSAAIHVSKPEDIGALLKFVGIHKQKFAKTSFHVLLEHPDLGYPHNVLRNLAMDHVESYYAVVVDGDFIPSPNSYHGLRDLVSNDKEFRHKLQSKTLFVLPAFDFFKPADNKAIKEDQLPRSKEALQRMVKSKTIEGFHMTVWEPGHNATNFVKWYQNDEDTYYDIEYEPFFEPYVLCFVPGVPKFFEGFRGFGMNKVSWFMEIHDAGFHFATLRDFFVVHMWHPAVDSATRKEHIKHNLPSFETFRQHLIKTYGASWEPYPELSKKALQANKESLEWKKQLAKKAPSATA